ncbi:MAG: alpha/beta fold hydrolase [Burkholderiales bacterium]|nr:alpha/beta fold hydrolase [Burkholderiales bacterium]
MTRSYEHAFEHPFERGMRNRREALGDAWVDKSVAKANTFNAEFQHFITDYAWHGVWGRPGLEWKTRRIIVLAVTSALGRWDEFEIHLRGALTPGNAHTLSVEEVREALIQIAIYAGVPAANTGFARALGVMRELGLEPQPHSADVAWHPGVGRSVFTTTRPKLHSTLREARNGQAQHTIVLSHALGQDGSMWDAVANELAATCNVICPDTRGHGRSQTPSEPLTMTELAADAARVIDEVADGEPVIWVGLSMGGLIGQELAIRHPDKVKALVLANTTSSYSGMGREAIGQRIATVEAHGMGAIATSTMTRFFSEEFRAAQAATVSRHQRLLESTDPEGYTACAAALCDANTTSRLGQIKVPSLVIAGSHDVSTPVETAYALTKGIAGAQMVNLQGCAHLSAVEQPQAFAAVVGEFIAGI